MCFSPSKYRVMLQAFSVSTFELVVGVKQLSSLTVSSALEGLYPKKSWNEFKKPCWFLPTYVTRGVSVMSVSQLKGVYTALFSLVAVEHSLWELGVIHICARFRDDDVCLSANVSCYKCLIICEINEKKIFTTQSTNKIRLDNKLPIYIVRFLLRLFSQ